MLNERQVDFQTFRINLDQKVSFSDHKNNRIKAKILSLCVAGAKSANAIVKVRFREGDELVLWPGRVVHLSQPTTEAVFSWEGQTGEYLDIEYSDKVLFPSSEFAKSTSLVSNIPARTSSKFVRVFFQPDLPYNDAQIKILEANPNRIKAVIESFSDRRIFLGAFEFTKEVTARSISTENCEKVNAFQTKILETSDAVYARIDDYSNGPSRDLSFAAYHILKVTEFLK